jgi:signal peptidase I
VPGGQAMLAPAEVADRSWAMAHAPTVVRPVPPPGPAVPRPSEPPEVEPRPRRPLLLTVIGAALAGAVLASLVWRLSGGGEFTIATASMCPDMCVGTLVLDRPLVGPAKPGMVVTFRPPGTTTIYTHRIVKVLADGSFETAGDALKQVDPWTVPPDRVIGRVVAHLPGAGWLWRCLPEMTAALACYLVARRSMRRSVRPHTDVLFLAFLLGVPTLTMRPFLRASVIAAGHRGATVVVHVANTGLLPARFAMSGGAIVPHVEAGHLATLIAHASSPLSLTETVSFSPWQWVLAALVIALPVLLLALRMAWARPGRTEEPDRPAPWVAAGRAPAVRRPSAPSPGGRAAVLRYRERR